MTRIPDSSPSPYVLSGAVRNNNSSPATPVKEDFPGLLNSQSESLRPPVNPANTPPQPKLGVQAPRVMDSRETLENLLANRAGRSANSASLTNGGSNDDPPVAGTLGSAEHNPVLDTDDIEALIARRAGFCWNALADDYSLQCAPNSHAVTEEPPASFIVWIPVESVRTPMQWKPRRPRKPPSSDNRHRDEAGENVDNTE